MHNINLNDAPAQKNFDLIPHGTLAKVFMTITPGGWVDSSRDWTDGYPTRSVSGSVYLRAEFIILGGEYDGRKVWSLIGLHSEKGPIYAEMGQRLTFSGYIVTGKQIGRAHV